MAVDEIWALYPGPWYRLSDLAEWTRLRRGGPVFLVRDGWGDVPLMVVATAGQADFLRRVFRWRGNVLSYGEATDLLSVFGVRPRSREEFQAVLESLPPPEPQMVARP